VPLARDALGADEAKRQRDLGPAKTVGEAFDYVADELDPLDT
jgi:hypothetical protein